MTFALAGTSVLSIGALDRALEKAYQGAAGTLELAGKLDAMLGHPIWVHFMGKKTNFMVKVNYFFIIQRIVIISYYF